MVTIDKRTPGTIRGITELHQEHRKGLHQVDYDYDYPNDLDLKPGSKQHEKLRSIILTAALESRKHIKQRFDSWREIDASLTAYVRPKTKKTNLNTKKSEDETTTIIVPLSYAERETVLTYMMAAFLQNPVFRFEGSGPEDEIGGILLEMIVQQHVIKNKIGLALHTMFADSFSYGIGLGHPNWKVKTALRRRVVPEEFTGLTGLFRRVFNREEAQRVTIYEGNNLDNIDPYMFLPDPNVPINRIQDSEHIGWVEKTNRTKLLQRERDEDDIIFNARYLKHIPGISSWLSTDQSKRADKQFGQTRSSSTSNISQPIDVVHKYIEIIPKEYKLGDSEYPEKWLFSLAGDEVIVSAMPLGLDHGDFPVVAMAPDYDGYSSTPVSRLEIISGMQESIDWLLTSHITNVKKSINDMMVVDPSLVNIQDLYDPEPGKLIRMRRTAFGRGVNDAVQQLQVNDVTQNHIADIGFMAGIMQRVSAASDNLQGLIDRRGSRISASEARGARSSALSRLEKAAKIIGMQGMQDMAYQFASNVQQLMTEEVYGKVTGRWQERLMKEYNVSPGDKFTVRPSDLLVNYDIEPFTGTMPGGEPADLWVDLFQIIAGNEQIAQQFDILRVVKHIARQMGAKNVDEFIRQDTNFQVQTDEQVQQQRQNGNAIPAEELGL